jgi:UDP-N-acetylglucosamine 2-epimerase (non-hydrolysing)
MKTKLLFVFGTRPEALKLAPVILESKKRKNVQTITCLTGQHREMVDQVLSLFKIKPDYDLNIMQRGQSLGDLTHRLLAAIQPVIAKVKPDCIVVQGDTTSAFVVALQAFYDKIPVAHVEAGLRSRDKHHPFPEEINRILISHVADYHFPPTKESKSNLLKEGISPKSIFVTGNTVVDALLEVRKMPAARNHALLKQLTANKKIILVTAHRRESFGGPFENICKALKEIAEKNRDVEIVYPVHLNPKVQEPVFRILSNHSRIRLLPPQSYEGFVALMNRAHFILTDSGGIQEEAPSFSKPVLVMRQVSERPDGIRLGVAKLVGTSRERIVKEANRLIRDVKAYQSMVQKRNPYGDGRASKKILDILVKGLAK